MRPCKLKKSNDYFSIFIFAQNNTLFFSSQGLTAAALNLVVFYFLFLKIGGEVNEMEETGV
jgi:hypothetical protein